MCRNRLVRTGHGKVPNMKMIGYIIGIILLIAMGFGLAFGGWSLTRAWNYNMSYKAMVKQTIIEMVKEDALKNPPKK